MELIRINEFKKKAKKRYHLHLFLVLLFLAVVATGLVLSIQLSPWQVSDVFMIINIVVSVLVTLATIFYFANIFPVITHYYKFYQNMTTVSLDHRRSRTYLSELESKNINHVNYRVLLFSYKEGEKEYKENLYVLDNDIQFKEGGNYKIATYRNVIVKSEDLNNAND